MHNVAVLKGGLSREREVSLVSGTACANGLRERGYKVLEIDVGRDVAVHLHSAAPDVCFNALHGPLGEDGSIQGLLNILGIPYTHSGVAASALAMDKTRTKLIARQLGLRVPAGRLITRGEFWAAPPERAFVIKPVNDGSSINTFVVRDPAVLPFARPEWPFAEVALMEEYIRGTEVTVTVLGDEPLTVTEILPAEGFYDYKAKYAVGGSRHVVPARIPSRTFERCMEQAMTVHRELGCRGISRSDFIVEEISGEPVFLEVNTQPGMTPTSLAPEQAKAVGISFPELMHHLILSAQTD